MMMNNERTYLVRVKRKNNMIMMINNMSRQMKDSMKAGLVAIGAIVLIGAALWLGYETYTIRSEMGRGISWMSSFL